jgi:hypothetical protein
MTIRQQGGVFGRNPTFNDVDIEGTLTVNGEPISDFGTMAQQDANSVNIDGGAIDGTVIGATTPATIAGTTGTFSGVVGHAAGTALLPSITQSADLNTGVWFPAADTVAVSTAGTERLRIESSGNVVFNENGVDADFRVESDTNTNALFVQGSDGFVGIGVASPLAPLHIAASSAGSIKLDNKNLGSPANFPSYTTKGSYLNSWLHGTGAGPYPYYADIVAAGDSSWGGRIRFLTNPNSSATGVERMRIDENGNVTINTGNLVIGTSGNGIDFSATAGTGTSELFDDYEEGTWTVELTDASTAGNASATTATGYYTKIGRAVHATFGPLNNIDTTGMTAGNAVRINLPFVAGQAAAGVLITDQLDFAAGKTAVYPMVAASSDRMTVIEAGDGVADGQVLVSAITSGATDIARMTVTYIV